MSYDTKCYDLAVDFLEDAQGEWKHVQVTESAKIKLAQGIQDYIEDFLQDDENFAHPEPPFDTGRERDEWKHEAAEQQRLK